MITDLYSIDAAAKQLGQSAEWLKRWLSRHPFDILGQPCFQLAGRTKVFRGVHLNRIRTAIEDEAVRRIRTNTRAKTDQGFIYFIAAGNFIKIGWSRNWQARLKSLRTANPNPIDVLLVVPGTRGDEGDLHCKFQNFRAHGEWYVPTQEMLDHIDLSEITGRPT